MDKFIINGGRKLSGSVPVSGAKNAVLPIMAATIITPGEFVLHNVPDLRDTRTMIRLLEIIGAVVEFKEGSLWIDTRSCDHPEAPYDVVKTMRASFDVLGPLMSRFNQARVSLPGGCAWGPRPVDLHLKAIKAMGGTVELAEGYIKTSGRLHGADIVFEISSVGATKNAMMAAVRANGQTTIHNAAREPEVTELCLFLQKMGAQISGAGTSRLIIEGSAQLNGGFEYSILPDRIEAGTYLIAGAMTRSDIELQNTNPRHLGIVLDKLQSIGLDLTITQDSIRMRSAGSIQSADITTAPYPGFPTDLQAQWMALMTTASGSSLIKEEIYKDRFTHVAELTRLWCRIRLEGNVAIVEGIDKLIGAPVMSTDIRASASLVIAGLAAEGTTEVSRVYHIDRGYDQIVRKFWNLGADITRAADD